MEFWTDFELVWARFRRNHPELYHPDIINSGWWPFLKPQDIERVR